MTREEEIKKEAYRVSYNGDEFSSFVLGAEWADKTMIDKACEWLLNVDFDCQQFRDCDESFNNDLLVDAFKKAMEEEI